MFMSAIAKLARFIVETIAPLPPSIPRVQPLREIIVIRDTPYKLSPHVSATAQRLPWNFSSPPSFKL